MPELYMVMNYTDAITMGLQEYVLISFYCEGLKLCLPVKFSDRLSSGQIGLPLGLPNIPPMLIGKNVFNLKQVI